MNIVNTYSAIHLGHKLDPITLDSIADFICGNDVKRFPIYRSSSYLTRFFQNAGISASHDGSTRKWWTLEILKQLQPSDVEKVVLRLVDLREYKGNQDLLKIAVRSMNDILLMDNLSINFNGIQPVLQKSSPINLSAEMLLKTKTPEDESEFLKKQFDDTITIQELGLDSVISSYLQSRVSEIQSCPKNKVSLGSIFLMGSALEGLLLAVAANNQEKFISSSSAPKDRSGKAKKIYDWKLSELIEVAHETNFIGLDVKKFSHVLRDFRNYIHPYQQMAQNFNPDQRTVDICWQVFKAAFFQLKSETRQ